MQQWMILSSFKNRSNPLIDESINIAEAKNAISNNMLTATYVSPKAKVLVAA
jgi:hypothetical protein